MGLLEPAERKISFSESYLNKKLVRRDPMAHVRVFIKDMRQLLRPAAH